MILENTFLRLEIATTGGRIVSLYDKIRERENAKMFSFVGGLNEIRFHGQLEVNDIESEYELSAVETGSADAAVRAVFHLPGAAGSVVKTYTLGENSSDIEISLQIINEGDEEMDLMPWVRHLLLRDEEQPEEAYMLAHGAFLRGRPAPGHPQRNPRFDWHYFPAGNWTSRVLLPMSERSNALVSVLRPEDMLKTYNWHRGTEDFATQEFIASPIFVKPGQTETWTYHIAVAAPVRNIVYVSPKLIIGATPHPSGIASDTRSLELAFAATEPMDQLQVEAQLNEIGGDQDVLNTEFSLSNLSPESVRAHTVDVVLEDGKNYQLQLTFTRDGKRYLPGAEVGDEYPVIIPLTVGNLHPEISVYPDRTSEISRLKRIQPREIQASRVGKSAGIEAFVRPTDTRVFSEDHFIPKTEGAVTLQAARGEYEAFQIALQSAFEQTQTFRVEATMLSNADGREIACDSVNKFLYVTTKMPSKYNALYPLGTYPEALLPTREIEVPANGNAPLFIMYRIPEDVPAGTYTGQVRIGEAMTIPVTLEVWNITLPKRSPWYDAPVSLKGLNTGGVVVKNDAGEEMSQAELLRAVEDIHLKHRLTPCDSGFTRSLLALDFETFEPVMQRYVDEGATKIYLGSINSVLKHGEAKLQDIEEYLEAKGWQDYFYVRSGFDEGSPDLIPQIAETCRQWKEVSTIPIMETYYHDKPEPLFGLLDIYCRNLATPEWVRKRMAAGDRFWKVNMKPEPLEFEPWIRRRSSLGFFDTGFTGTYIWTIKQWNGVTEWGEDYWCDGGVGNLDSVMIWPHETGLLSTIRLEVMREAIEDNALLWMLKGRVNALTGRRLDDPAQIAALADARALCSGDPLEETVESVEDLHRLRSRVGNALSVLNGIE